MGRKTSLQRQAERRIASLFEEAKKTECKDLQDRYVEIAWNLKLRANASFTPTQKLRYCKRCGSYLTPGQNLRTRLNKPVVSKRCLECGDTSRYRYKE